MKYLHQSPYTFLVVVNIMLPVDSNRHLPVSENPVLFFVQFFYPLNNLFVLKLSAAWFSMQPFVICTSVDAQFLAQFFYWIFRGYM